MVKQTRPVNSISSAVKPEIFRLALGLVTGLLSIGATLGIPLVLELLVDRVEEESSVSAVMGASILIALVGVGEAALIATRRALVLEPGTRVEARLRKRLFSNIQRQPLSTADSWSSGEVLTRLMTDADQVRQWLAFWSIQLVADFGIFLVGTIVIASYDIRVAMLSLLVSAPLVILVYRFQRHDTRRASEVMASSAAVATFAEESVFGARTVKSFNQASARQQAYALLLAQKSELELARADRRANFVAAMALFPSLSVLVCVVSGAALVAMNELQAGAAMAMVATAIVVQPAILSIGLSVSKTVDAAVSRRRVMQVLEITAEPHPQTSPPAGGGSGGIGLQDVTVEIESQGTVQRVLDGVSFFVPPGETLAIVGRSGAGKTTLAEVIAGLRPHAQGTINVSSVAVTRDNYPLLRKSVSYVAETPELVVGTVRDVLVGSRIDIDESQMWAALRKSNCDFVASLPDGLDTEVGELSGLSGGERQRLALARALVDHREVIVLDDPLSGLDLATERLVEDALRESLRGRTAIIVARRVSTLDLASRVVLLDAGRAVDSGRHEELARRNQDYREILGMGPASEEV